VSIQGLAELVARIRSGVVHVIIHSGKERLGSGTGFFVANMLITNHHIALGIPTGAQLAVRFHDTPPAHADYSFSADQIQNAVCGTSDDSAYDYAILDLPDLLQYNPYQFKFAAHDPKVGQSVALLGYPLDQWHLTCHAGIVSAIYPSGEATMLQFDASVEPSNSGGPLFDETGDVLGIVTRRVTGLTNAFDDLLKSFDEAISVLSGTNFFTTTSRAMVSIQQEMKEVARQLQRSASVGTGFAIACDEIKKENIWRTRLNRK
jgi:S1-C subfamily serine protease